MAVTYQASGADLDSGCGEVDRAVSGSEDGVGIKQDTAAEVRAAARQTDDVGELSRSSCSSTNDFRTIGASYRLGHGSC